MTGTLMFGSNLAFEQTIRICSQLNSDKYVELIMVENISKSYNNIFLHENTSIHSRHLKRVVRQKNDHHNQWFGSDPKLT